MDTKTYAVVDLETTGHSSAKGDRIIQIAIVLIKNGKIEQRYMRFVDPCQKIPPFIRELTNINDEDVEGAPTFEEIAEEVRQLLEGTVFVAHNTAFDLPFLQSEFKRCQVGEWSGNQIDTVELSKIVFPSLASYRLQDIAEELGIQLPSAHRADDDAEATSELLLQCYEKLHTLPLETLELLHKRSFKLKSDLASLFYTVLKNVRGKRQRIQYSKFRGIPFKPVTPTSSIQYGDVSYPTQEVQKTKLFKEAFPNFEKRSSQFAFMDTVWRTLTEKSEVAAEVPTGIGKTIAYLLPAAFRSIEQGKPVVISTYTNYLVDKIVVSELEKISNMLNITLKATVLKGREHYISLGKFEELHTLTDQSYDETFSIMQILVWLTETTTGDLGELTVSGGGQLFIDRIRNRSVSVSNEEREVDYYRQHLQACENSNFIITNHAMLLSDINRTEPIFDNIAGLVVDEAHQLVHTAARLSETVFSYTTWKYIMGQLTSTAEGQLLSEIMTLADRLGVSIPKIETIMSSFEQFTTVFDEVANQLAYFVPSTIKKQVGHRKTFALNELQNMRKQYEKVSTLMFEYLDFAESIERRFAIHTSNMTKSECALIAEWSYWVRELKIKAGEWVELFLEHDPQKYAIWIERDQRSLPSSLMAIRHPLDSSATIQKFTERLKVNRTGIIWTSGTLAIGQRTRYIPTQLGLDETVPLEVFEAPTDFYNGAEMYIVNNMPDIQQVSQSDYIEEVANAVIQTTMATGGRLFVLFTSRDMMKKTYELIIDSEQLEEYALFAQGISGGSRMKLLKSFHQFNQSVLFGTSSFWEGVDVPGDALSAVIVVRLPFTSPEDPIFKANAEKLTAEGKNPFTEYALPEAVMRMRQGFGRLIRSSSDKGAFIILDRRIEAKSYGKHFIDALPNVHVKKVPLEVMVYELENCYNKRR
ncbi:ATP-dependent DNA helicase DinG [Sporosarcina pasteurii]|uniref:3'-5' exonuclease DinG n=1 Tax=Sporosarcina pasteurii TaxID=1474 RepID=A0A380BKL9_SPOPA|nr:ATP-dependent DNA helicase DinG [Sporosarcina pasteurii]MDS9470845.1 ATP-dependent DNA helicase DinG [Sporosarcina pasteurii]QBQ05488.1 ATP-dependent DNA helicase DinG [Sporosarcina pasteurii]SUJ02878.1 Probable ATP-dependent helicase dinG homolog [Sporosarcina pasteurii]